MRTELSYIDIEVAFGLGFAFIIHTKGQFFFNYYLVIFTITSFITKVLVSLALLTILHYPNGP